MKLKVLIVIGLLFNLLFLFSCKKSKSVSFAIQEDSLAIKNNIESSIKKARNIQNKYDTGTEHTVQKVLSNKKEKIECDIVERYHIPLSTNLLDTSYLGRPNFGQLYPTNYSQQLMKSYNKAFYLGVYTSDLVYTVIYDNRQLFYQYYATVMELSNELGIKQTFTSEMLDKFRENYRNDTVQLLIRESLTKTCKFLDDNDQIGILPFMLVGSWDESMYLAVGNAIYNDNIPLDIYKLIASQDKVIDKLKKLLDDNLLAVEDYSLSMALHELIDNLDSVKTIYQSIYVSNNTAIDKESLKTLYQAFDELKSKYR